MKKTHLIIILGCLSGLSSCLSEKPGPNLPRYECYQIRNEFSGSVTLHFYQEGTPKTIYAESWDGDFKTDIPNPPAAKSTSGLMSDSCISLSEGQTVLLYQHKPYPNWPDSTAYGMKSLGEGIPVLFFDNISSFAGDSIVVSIAGRKDSVFRTGDYSLWETWYAEKQFVYYHYWRLGKDF